METRRHADGVMCLPLQLFLQDPRCSLCLHMFDGTERYSADWPLSHAGWLHTLPQLNPQPSTTVCRCPSKKCIISHYPPVSGLPCTSWPEDRLL